MSFGRISQRIGLVAALLALALVTACCSQAMAQDLSAALGEAESRAEVASADVAELEAAVGPAKTRFEASADRAAPILAASRKADRQVEAIEDRLRARRLAAISKVSRIEEEKRDAADEHDEAVRFGIGLGLAALIAAGIAFAWDWFRASTLVAWLTRLPLGQAVGLCVGGGLLLVIVGAAMSASTGIAGVVGVALLVLGFVLANALVLARHSAEVQRGRSKPILRRERMPRRVTQVVAGVFAALCLLGLGTAVFTGESESSEASATLRRQASGKEMDTPSIVAAEAKAAGLRRKASPLLADARAAKGDLRAVRRKLARFEKQLARAEGDIASFSHRLVVVTEREERKAEAEARRTARRIAQEEAEACNPNYSGCLDPSASDYDCEGGSGDGPLYTGTVEVIGYDEYGLDDDGDGIGCE